MKLADLTADGRRQRRFHDDLASLFVTPTGHRVLRELAEKYHVFKPVHVPGDPAQTAFNDGQRHIILELIYAAHLPNPFTLLENPTDARHSDDRHADTDAGLPPVPSLDA